MQYLIAIDSDGTLRHTDGTITNKTKSVIKNIIAKGHYVVICTARPRYHTLKIGEEVGANKYLISSNGSEVFDNINQKIIYCSYLPNNICKKIYEDISSQNIRAVFVTENKEYVTQFTRNDSQILLNDKNADELFHKDIKQIMIIGKEKAKIIEYKNYVEKEYKLNIIDASIENNEEEWFSIIDSNASKGIALEKLANYLNIPKQNIIAIGNDNNDISMFATAGISVAVANASIDIKKIVNYVSLTNDEDGVASFLENMFK